MKEFTRDDFMKFFRDDEQLKTLSTDDRIAIFETVLVGSSDFSKELLDGILSDYIVGEIEVIEKGD
jgi:hypothetical protein